MKNGFFTRLDWTAFWTATLVTLFVYVMTLGPSVGLEDSGELATAAASLGVPHPPGYPFWTFCSWIFCKLFSWVTYMGHPTPAWCVSLCSAVFGAFASGCTAMLICRSARDFVSDETDGANILAFAGGVAGAMTFALSPVEWSQSTIVEIYSLNALFLMWVFLLSYRWMKRPSDKILWATAFVFGLGLTNYQVLLFAIVPLAAIILIKNLSMFRDVVLYLIPVALTCQILQIGQLYRADRYMSSDAIAKHEPLINKAIWTPSSTMIVLAAVVIVASIVAAILMRRKYPEKAFRVVVWGGIGGLILMSLMAILFQSKMIWSGVSEEVAPLLSPFVYLSIAVILFASVICSVLSVLSPNRKEKEVFNPFLYAACGCVIAAVLIALTVPAASSAGYVGVPYPWGWSFLVFLSLLTIFGVIAWKTPNGLAYAIPVAGVQTAVFVLLMKGGMNGLTHPCSWWFWWPIVWNFVLLAMVWLMLPNGRSVAGAAFFAQLGVSFYAYMPIVSDLRNPAMNWGYPRTWEGFKHAIQRGQYEAISFHLPTLEQIRNYLVDVRVQFTDVFAAFAVIPFAVGHWIVKKENRKAFWQWMIPALICFLMMSVLLIGLANVKGDLQDGFIQKVKFISSHAMLALWIGYGCVFASVFFVSLLKKTGTIAARLFAGAIAIILIVLAITFPLVDNYGGSVYKLGVNEVAFKLGASEQNGHTFGWQFGAYQLEGAAAINEQLIADEEPLPDPTYPPPMDKFSIFFGGTDPGRFVPTYMIYSANYRPDVYLITQNALADDTYMSVQRDLYGDEIWIPAKEDSEDAFNRYVDEVKSGVRNANGDLRIENGRVQVTGALGVMEINGILTEMMFEHDRRRHSFYVEESYPIPWMYPYLTPHGLILKLNADSTTIDASLEKKDRDFWDWYTRRLLDDPAFGRDFAGQKSFSKLRAAIAGLYLQKGKISSDWKLMRSGAQAFREAMLLYPPAPEANFRYVQDVLMPFEKWDIAMELMDYSEYLDPLSRRAGILRTNIFQMRRIKAELKRLEAKYRDPKADPLTVAETFTLAQCYYEVGRIGDAGVMARSIVNKMEEPRGLMLLVHLLNRANMLTDAELCLTRYLSKEPNDADGWADLAKIQSRLHKDSTALYSFKKALSLDRRRMMMRLREEDDLLEIAEPLLRQR